MVTMERPIMVHLVESPEAKEKWGFEPRLRPIVSELVNLDYSGWLQRFADNGFTDAHVQTLDALVEAWTGQIDVDDLSEQLAAVEDISDAAELEHTVGDWLERVPRDGISTIVARAEFPSKFGAVCYALGQLAHIIGGAIEFEKIQREARLQSAADWSMTPEQVAEGIALAETGLGENAKTWHRYRDAKYDGQT